MAGTLAGPLADRNPSERELAWKAVLLIDRSVQSMQSAQSMHSGGGTRDSEMLQGAGRWLQERLSGPSPQQPDGLPGASATKFMVERSDDSLLFAASFPSLNEHISFERLPRLLRLRVKA